MSDILPEEKKLPSNKKPNDTPQWQLEDIAARITQKTGRYTSPEWVRDNVWIRQDHPKPGWDTFWY